MTTPLATRPTPALMPTRRPVAQAPTPTTTPTAAITLHPHCISEARIKGFTTTAVLDAANNPAVTYANGRYEGQMRHIKGDIVVIVDPARNLAITCYANIRATNLRDSQRTDANAKDALAYEKRLQSGTYADL